MHNDFHDNDLKDGCLILFCVSDKWLRLGRSMAFYRWFVLVFVCTQLGTGLGIPVRLVHKPVPHAGRVEVFYKGVWGSICDDYWNIEDALVVCRQLGFTGALSAPCCTVFPANQSSTNQTGRFWLDDVNCRGNETDIGECRHNPWGITDCRYPSSQANVICIPTNYTNDYSLRLTGALVPYAGRVEVLHAGIWGDIDNIGWDINDGHVACRSLGYSRAVTVIYSAARVFKVVQNIVKWLKNIECRGNETRLTECPFAVETERSSYGFSAGVLCQQNNATTPLFRLAFNNNTVPYAGRIEVQLAKMWGIVNDNQWDMTSSHVICKQLGYAGAEMVLHGATNVLGIKGKPMIEWIRNFKCNGSENSLADCSYSIHFNNDGSNDAGVVCATNHSDVRFRLSGGGKSYGRVETYYAGVWGTVHNAGFNIKAAKVVCNQLGLSGSPDIIKFAAGPFGSGTGPVWLTRLSCYGNESNLWDCEHSRVMKDMWSHDYDAGVVCDSSQSDLKVRLSGSYYGRVEISYLGVWGTMSGASFNKTVADVICRQLDYPSSLESFKYGAFGGGQGPVWLNDVLCSGNETNIGSCLYDGFSSVYPTHLDDASVVCYTGISYEDFKIRLEGGGYSNGRVEVQYKGIWGSVVHVRDKDSQRVGHVMCRQLGFSGLNKTIFNAATIYGSGTGPVWMTHVRCLGNESNIGECFFEKDFHARYPEFGLICNSTRKPTSSPPATTGSSSTPVPSKLSKFVTIGVPVIVGIVAFVIILVLFIKVCKKRGKYTTSNEFVRMDDASSQRSIERGDMHSFRNIALEMEDERTEWLEIPRSDVTQTDEEIERENNQVIRKGQLKTNGGSVRSCLVKSISGCDERPVVSNELKTVCRLDKHPNILDFIGACSLEGPLLLIFEFPECGNMLHYLRKHQVIADDNDNQTSRTCGLPKAERLRLALEVATGMKWLAQQKCIHGYLAAKNVYLGKQGSAKIANIGASRDCDITKDDYRWMAPECMESSKFSTKSDVWSYGVFLWEIETGGLSPYSEIENNEIYPKLKSGYRLQKPLNCSDKIYSIITQCHRDKPDQRPDFGKVSGLVEAIVVEETAC